MERPARSLTVADLQKIGVSKPYAHQLLSGDRTPSLKLAVHIEATYEIAPRAWLAHPDTPPPADAPVVPDAEADVALENGGGSQ